MPLAPGSRLASYDIVAPLGSGGMGEVWRARDSRLGRDVAIKVLPQAVATDPERLARLEREARSVAGLNHPNIVTLHSIEAKQQLIDKHAWESSFQLAGVCAFRGEFDEAFHWLEHGLATRDQGMGLVHGDPIFRPLHSDPRWRELMKTLGYEVLT